MHIIWIFRWNKKFHRLQYTWDVCVCAHKIGITSEHTHRIHLYIYMQAIVSLSAFEFNGSGGQAKKEWWFGLIALLNIRHSRERSIWLANPSSNTTGRMRNIWLHREVFTHYYTLLPNGLSFSLSLHHSPVCNVHVSRFPKMATPNLLQYIYIYTTLIRWCVAKWTKPPKIKTDENNTTLLYYMKMKIINKAEKKEKLWLNHNIKWIQHRGRRQKLHHHHRITSKAWARAHTAPQSLSTPWPKKKIININTEV